MSHRSYVGNQTHREQSNTGGNQLQCSQENRSQTPFFAINLNEINSTQKNKSNTQRGTEDKIKMLDS